MVHSLQRLQYICSFSIYLNSFIERFFSYRKIMQTTMATAVQLSVGSRYCCKRSEGTHKACETIMRTIPRTYRTCLPQQLMSVSMVTNTSGKYGCATCNSGYNTVWSMERDALDCAWCDGPNYTVAHYRQTGPRAIDPARRYVYSRIMASWLWSSSRLTLPLVQI